MEAIKKPPTIYEINTPVFLYEVGKRAGHTVTLATVPDAEWDAIARPGIDTVWFMGIWQRSAIAKEMAKSEEWLQDALPDMRVEDLLGSAYSISDDVVDASFGGNDGLAQARVELRRRGIGIMLDYVPNHVGIDHVWATTPEYSDHFLPGTPDELAAHPEAFVQTHIGIVAKAKDPNFEPWSDVLQLNAFSPTLRTEVAATLSAIAGMCDGVRCDMAMLMMNTIFKATWGERAADVPADEYWPAIIAAARQANPDFIFLAEVYWDRQQDLLAQGFDFCYDKDLYDYLLDGSVDRIIQHLQQPASYQQHLLRFLENHDEERAAKEFPLEKHIAAAVITAMLPGAQLYHDGEREGRTIRVPVHLGRRTDEPVNDLVALFYDKLWAYKASKKCIQGNWQFIPVYTSFWHRTSHQVVAWQWTSEGNRCVIIVNYSPEKASVTVGAKVDHPTSADDISVGSVDASRYLHGSQVTLEPWAHVILSFAR